MELNRQSVPPGEGREATRPSFSEEGGVCNEVTGKPPPVSEKFRSFFGRG
jgi:hypothetical protein